jgi:hypothetical protein
MARVPDRFDLWVRKARETADTGRQVDWILGGLVAQGELCFLNIGTQARPLIARTGIAEGECVLVFTDRGRIEDFLAERPEAARRGAEGPPVIASPAGAALAWCVENGAGLVINPGVGEAAMVPAAAVAKFTAEWRARGERRGAGFWIPNMTTEEEDFWQEHGL